MIATLHTYSRDLQSALSNTNPTSSVLQLDYTSPIDSIYAALKEAANSTEQLEYWSTIFLLGCEINGPAIPILNAQNFVVALTYALYGVTIRGDQNFKDLCAPSIDQLLINELTEEFGDQVLNILFTIIKPAYDYKHLFPNYEFICFKQANILLNSLWTGIKNFIVNEVPDDSIVDVCRQLSEARKLGLYTKDIAYTLTEYIFIYINQLKLEQIGQPNYSFPADKFKKSNELITLFDEFNEDQEIKVEIDNYKVLLENAKNYQPIISSTSATTPRDQAPEFYILDKKLVTRSPKPKYSVPRGNLQISIYDGELSGAHVCIKVYEANPNQKHELSKANNEIKIYETLSRAANDSNCFLKYYGTYLEENSLCMVMEYYGSSLMDCIKQLKDSNFKLLENQFIGITYKVLSSFKLMKDMNILHNDIKPHNMLVDQNWNIKIIDFGISVAQIQAITFSSTQVLPIQGTEGYLSPEKKLAIQNDQKQAKYNLEKSDVYSLGLVFYQLLTFKNVENLRNQDFIRDINSYVGYSKEIKVLLCRMLDENPLTRPDFSQALALMKEVPITKTFH